MAGCASDHDLKRDPVTFTGAGFIDRVVAPGVYEIKAFSDNLLFVSSAARTFDSRASTLCPSGFAEVRAVEDTRRGTGAPTSHIQSKIGYVRCNDSLLTMREAQALVAPSE